MRQHCKGFGFTKYAVFWESPFERFLHLDADTIVWGDILKYSTFEDNNFIIDQPTFEYSLEFIDETMFNPSILNKYFPDYEILHKPYVCSGVFFAKRNSFDLADFKKLMEIHQKEPHLWKCGEQGMFNFMIFDGKEKQKLKVKSDYFQYVVIEYPKEDTASRFNNKNLFAKNIGKPFVIHWCGRSKPHVRNAQGYNTELMTTFRKKFLADSGVPQFLHDPILKKEDMNYTYLMQKSYFKRRIRERVKKAWSNFNV